MAIDLVLMAQSESLVAINPVLVAQSQLLLAITSLHSS